MRFHDESSITKGGYEGAIAPFFPFSVSCFTYFLPLCHSMFNFSDISKPNKMCFFWYAFWITWIWFAKPLGAMLCGSLLHYPCLHFITILAICLSDKSSREPLRGKLTVTEKLSVKGLLTDKLSVRPSLTDKLSVRPLLTDKLPVRTKKKSFFHGLINKWRKKIKWHIQSTVPCIVFFSILIR